jgi:hypothetical protein
VVKVHHRHLDATPRLAGVGKDRQQGDRSGVEMNCLNLVCL